MMKTEDLKQLSNHSEQIGKTPSEARLNAAIAAIRGETNGT